MNTHPYSVFSLQDECDSVVKAYADKKHPPSSLGVRRVARAIRTLATVNVADASDEEKLLIAASRVSEHVQKFKEHRQRVYMDFFNECREGTLRATHAEEMQLKCIFEFLGVKGKVFDNETGTWLTFNARPGSDDGELSVHDPKQLTVIIMKNRDHYFAVIELDQLLDIYQPTERENKLCAKVYQKLSNFVSEDNISLKRNSEFVSKVHENVAREWHRDDSAADIYSAFMKAPPAPEVMKF
jgi:hypothetical protein